MQVLYLLFLITLTVQKPNLFIGTAGFGFGCGSNSPAAQVPYSFVRLGPDTTPLTKKLYAQFQHFGGYDNTDHGIRAFSHMHLVGAGVQDLGILGVLPMLSDKNGKNPSVPVDPKVTFYKDTQVAKPGYYSTILENNIKVQLTTTQRCGIHKYTFPAGNKKHDILFMPTYLLQKKAERNARINLCISGEQNCLEGYMYLKGSFGGRFGGYKIYFTIRYELSQRASNTIYFYNQTSISNEDIKAQGKLCGAILQTNSSTVVIKIGLSYVDLVNARENLMMEVLLEENTFEDILNKSLSIWEKELSRFQISAVTDSMKQKIDTAIYRTLLSPTIFNDFNGDYVSFANNGTIMKKPQNMNAVYTDMSLWDVHRSQLPWLLFQDLQRFNDIARSIMLINYQGQYMPKWPFAMGPTGCMIGAHANTVLADWIIKEPLSSNQTEKKTILNYMKRNADERTVHDSRYDPKNYKKLGYIPFDKASGSGCSETLQYSYNDFGISRVARILNQTDTQVDFFNRSKFYKNLWNKQSNFFQPKYSNGSFFHISPKERTNIFSKYYVQGNAWHYRFYAPHDPKGLIQLFKSNQAFVKQLNKFFYRSLFWPTLWLPNPYYWAGNQHDLFSVWLFGFANRSDLTQKYSRKILLTQYGNNGAGLPGNDDYGTMSAWLIFASLGFYPVPSTQNYVIGSPTIHSARIYRRMSKDKLVPFNIEVTGNNNNKYLVKQKILNGKKINGNLLSHNDLRESNSYLGFVL